MTEFRHALLVPSLLAGLVAALAGCRVSTAPMHPQHEGGQWYQVEAGESLAEIARRAGVPAEDLLEVNGLHDAGEVRAGSLIYVLDGPAGRVQLTPEGSATASAEGGGVREADATETPADATRGPSSPSAGALVRLRWPVAEPRVTSFFGARWGRKHEGIDLTATIGTPVYAADGGEVVYAGSRLRGYGNMVVLRHAGDLMTVYAHNSVLLVRVGERVKPGQRVALSGRSGHASGPHVHFEVRKAQVPRDPLPFLPALRVLSPRS